MKSMTRANPSICKFCLRRLDAANKEPSSEIIKVTNATSNATNHYHKSCWDQLIDKRGAQFGEKIESSLQVSTSAASKIIQRRPGFRNLQVPANTVNDYPLGISTSYILTHPQEGEPEETSFTVQNNGETNITLSRVQMPAWAYLSYGNYESQSENVILQPAQGTTVTVHSHPCAPESMGMELHVGENQRVMLIASNSALWKWIAIALLAVIAFLHLNSFGAWLGTGPNFLTPLLVHIFTFGLFVAWLFFMMPARMIWLGYKVVDKILNLSRFPQQGPVFNYASQGKKYLWSLFEGGELVKWGSNIFILLSLSLGVGLSCALLSLPIWYLLNALTHLFRSVLGGLATLLIWIGYWYSIIYLVDKILLEYQVGIFDWIRTQIVKRRS